MTKFKGEAASFALSLAKLDADKQNLYFRYLEDTGILKKSEIEAMKIVVAYFRLQIFPERTEEMKKVMAEKMYKEFNQVV